jgi:glycosyltransferase involved in cell wall biosynthesis
MTPKRIALVSEHASPAAVLGGTDCGGQNVYVAQLALELAARGHRVDVFTRRCCADTATTVNWAPRVQIVHVDAGPATSIRKEELLPFMPEFASFMVDYVRCRGVHYDIAHANFWTSAVATSLVKRSIGTPYVVTFHALGRVRRLHQGTADDFPLERGDIEEFLVHDADAVIAECPQDADDLATHYGARGGRMRIIPCGVDCHQFYPIDKARARAALHLDTARPTLLQLGRMVPRKGVDDAIRAVAELRDRHGIDARLLVVGGESELPDESTTPYLRDLRAVAASLGVDDRVTFVGRRSGDALRYYYSAADAFITTPWYEPFGITPLEAMACGTPVIGANVGGIKYTVRDGETGFLVPSRDPVAIAARTAVLLRNPELCAQMSRTAIDRVRCAFRWSDVAAAVDELYGDVLCANEGHLQIDRRDALTESRA